MWDVRFAVKVRVRLFSILRERAGAAQAELELPRGSTLGDAVRALRDDHPSLGPLLEGNERLRLLFAVNREYADRAQRLHDGDEIALLPPVSGGAAEQIPAESAGHGLLLLSGGFDSPVAGHLILASGRTLEAVHFTMEPFTDDASAHKARRLAKILGFARLTIVPLGEELAEFTRRCDHRVYFVLLKRLMFRIAERIAGRHGATFLVTGENLGQVSSQTLANLASIDAVSRLPVLRPLLGLDKHEIIRAARAIGTFEASRGPELCDLLGPKHPATATTAARVEAEESHVNLGALIETALTRAHEVILDGAPLDPGSSNRADGGVSRPALGREAVAPPRGRSHERSLPLAP